MTLTRVQRDLLSVLAASPGLNFTGGDLARLLYTNHRSQQGAAQTASSLVRRGLVHKDRDIDGHVCYRVTTAGQAALA